MDVFIYTLNDIETGKPFYVGQTSRPRIRLALHLSNARFAFGLRLRSPEFFAKHWTRGVAVRIVSLWDIEHSFDMQIIETAEQSNASIRERYWIEMMRSEGNDLANILMPFRNYERNEVRR